MCKPKALTALKVFDTFHLIAKESGKDSQGKKMSHLRALLVVVAGCEPQYLINLLQKKLGIGLAEKTLLAALGHAALYSEKHSTRPVKARNSLEEVIIYIYVAIFRHKNNMEYVNVVSSLQYRKMDFEEFCAAAISVYQLEGMESWEQHARRAYDFFEKDGNRPIMIEELASAHKAKRPRRKGAAVGKQIRKAHPMRKSLAEAGTSFETGVRRSKRIRMRRDLWNSGKERDSYMVVWMTKSSAARKYEHNYLYGAD
ncbi:CDPK-related kinase 1 [Phtheirospermum japonicum]|uniref:CDPK-related kinase 1 n=1 Tax=Phtheirospermum japonicum TaxID=374723 RepID=A0A830D5D5_9LAMI|nr:CDPK-related kinase 1 [Phtheirospermum japonicum]